MIESLFSSAVPTSILASALTAPTSIITVASAATPSILAKGSTT